MCNYRYEIWDTRLRDSNATYDEAMLDTVYGVNEASRAQAVEIAMAYSKNNPANKISICAWDCGGPYGDEEYFLDGKPLVNTPSVGYTIRGRFHYQNSAMAGRIVGSKERKQRNDLLGMVNLIETKLRDHPSDCDCEVCTLFRDYIRDDKTKIEAELAGYRLYTKEDAEKLDADIAESRRKEKACREWMEWLKDNHQLLQIEGFAEEVVSDMAKLIDNLDNGVDNE